MIPHTHFPPREQHTHYHYHFHYPNVQIDQQPPPQSQNPFSARMDFKSSLPRTYSSAIQTNHWKRHVNPQVSKLYDNFQTKKSRFSQKQDKINEQQYSVLQTSQMKNKFEKSYEQDTTFGQMRPLSKLQSLYYSKTKKQKYNGQVESVTNETQEHIYNSNEQKIKKYEKQIERLRRYEEECTYLRDHFMLHVEKKHPKQL